MTAVADAKIEIFQTRETITLRGVVTDRNGNNADPSGGVQGWYVKPSGGARIALAFTHIDTGIYEAQVTAATGEDGDWWWRFETLGTIGGFADVVTGERTFVVEEQQVV